MSSSVRAGAAGEASDLDILTGSAAAGGVDGLFRDTVEHAPIGIAFANRDGSFRHCNQHFCLMVGYTAEELARHTIVGLTAPEDLEQTRQALERLWRGEVTDVDIEKRYIGKDGSPLWVRATTSLVRAGQAAPECSVEFLRDISARKAMAAALLQNQTLLATVITQLPLALLACDVKGRITHYNKAAVELFGIAEEDAAATLIRTGYPITSQVFLPGGVTPLPRAERPLAQALRGQDVSDTELWIVPLGGRPRVTLSSARRLVAPDGELLGAVAVVQDITERRHAEEELERVHKQLLDASRQAGMAEVATNVLHNVGNVLNSVNVSASLVAERIKKSKCSGLGRVVSLLTANAADLATFMAGNQGRHLPPYLEQLAAELIAERDTAVAELTALRSNVEHIKEIVAMQQGYAKRGGLTDTLDIRSVVEDSLRMNEGAFSRHGVTIVRDFAPELPPVQVDKHKVLQILVNIIRNAKYACEEGGSGAKKVTVRVRPGIGCVHIAVIDTGVGIPRQNLERIFNHGFTTRRQGHGFGLHSSALAAKALGGSLEVESAGRNLGATFTLTLPLTAGDSSSGE